MLSSSPSVSLFTSMRTGQLEDVKLGDPSTGVSEDVTVGVGFIASATTSAIESREVMMELIPMSFVDAWTLGLLAF